MTPVADLPVRCLLTVHQRGVQNQKQFFTAHGDFGRKARQMGQRTGLMTQARGDYPDHRKLPRVAKRSTHHVAR